MALPLPPAPGLLYLLDTNILMAYVRGGPLGRRIEADYSLLTTLNVPLISIVTEGEIRSLAVRLGWGAARMRQLAFLLSTFTRVSLDAPGVLDAYVAIDAYSARNGRAMGKNDVWIAATAHATSATLLTTDRDFDHLHPNFIDRQWIDENA